MRPSPLAAVLLLALSTVAWAQAPAGNASEEDKSPFTLAGYVEAFYQWNFNVPFNGITNFRGFDNRHNSFTLSNVALGVNWDDGSLIGRLTLQVGATPSTYYLSEPELPGSEGANATGRELWKYLQQAYVGYRFGVGRGLTLTAGLFLSAIGPETMAVHENWNWSRSNLFFGLPFYHTCIHASYPLSEAWTVSLAGLNGWNSVVDNNAEKSISAQLGFKRTHLALSFLYFGGVERPTHAPEGRPWRHLFDAHATRSARSWLSLRAHLDGGFEHNTFGVSFWAAAALGARFRLRDGSTSRCAVTGSTKRLRKTAPAARRRSSGPCPGLPPAPRRSTTDRTSGSPSCSSSDTTAPEARSSSVAASSPRARLRTP